MTPRQRDALDALEASGSITIPQLAQIMGTGVEAARNALHALCDAGHAHLADKVQRDGRTGRRLHLFALGPGDGYELPRRCRPAVVKALREMQRATPRELAIRAGVDERTTRGILLAMERTLCARRAGLDTSANVGRPSHIWEIA